VGQVPPATAAIRVAVRRYLSGNDTGSILVACSGGADSLALAAATAFVAPRLGRAAGLVTIDHRLQSGSDGRARELVSWAKDQGLAPAVARSVQVTDFEGGPEAAAREARYAALTEVAQEHGAGTVLLGHTRDDQAETVLLALSRGSGVRGISGMPAQRLRDGILFARPLLTISRAQTMQACGELGLQPWQDPHNADSRFARSRVRHDALPALVEALGPDVVANLAQTAALAAQDNQVLEQLAAQEWQQVDADGLDARMLSAQPDAIRRRLIRRWLLGLGVRAGELGHRHIDAVDALLTDWHGQGPVALPGDVWVARIGGRLERAP
jgi:tRNA(Ile)-lysidine synthase